MEHATVGTVQRRLPSVLIMGLALYFGWVFGIAGGKTLLWMQFGLTDFATGAITHSAGRLFELNDRSLTYVTAGLGSAKLAVAGYLLLAMLEHASVVFRGTRVPDSGTLDLAVFAGAGLTLLYAYPAWVIGETTELRTHMAHVILLCVLAGSALYQRRPKRPPSTRVGYLEDTEPLAPRPDGDLVADRAPLAWDRT